MTAQGVCPACGAIVHLAVGGTTGGVWRCGSCGHTFQRLNWSATGTAPLATPPPTATAWVPTARPVVPVAGSVPVARAADGLAPANGIQSVGEINSSRRAGPRDKPAGALTQVSWVVVGWLLSAAIGVGLGYLVIVSLKGPAGDFLHLFTHEG
jgi:hypothetical protein